MPLIVIGANHRTAPVEVRERLAFAPGDLGPALRTLVHGEEEIAQEAVLLSTCHRTEVYALLSSGHRRRLADFLAAHSGLRPVDIEPVLYAHEDGAAVVHLFRVAAGLDSSILGETEVLGQVRRALREAREHRAVGPLLTRLFEIALTVGKRARTETAIARQPLSLSHVAVDLAYRVEGDLSSRRILIIGGGKVGEQTARYLADREVREVRVINRHPRRAARLAEIVGRHALPLRALGEELARADVVFAATHGSRFMIDLPLVRRATENRRDRPLLLLDLGLPRNVDPAVAQVEGIRLCDLDDLEGIVQESMVQRRGEVPKVERIVEEETEAFLTWWRSRGVAPTIKALRRRARLIRDAEVDKALRRLGPLSPQGERAVRSLADSLLNKLLHEPTVRLKAQAAEGNGAGYAEVLEELFGLAEAEEDGQT